MKFAKFAAITVALVFLMTTFAMADMQGTANGGHAGDPPLTLGVWAGPYDEFIGVGGFFAEDWTYTGAATLVVTDLYVPGDEFNIYDNGILIGSSNAVPDWSTFEDSPYDSPPWTDDPETAYNDAEYFSHFGYDLGAGSHDITIQATNLPSGFSDSTVTLEVVTPEPGSILLFGTGLAGLAGMIRRKLAK